MNVYIIESNGIFKVGLANNVAKRKRSLQTSNPYTLKLIDCVKLKSRKQAKAVEAMMHKKFEKQRKRGEWFTTPKEELKEGLKELSSIYVEAESNPQALKKVPAKFRRYKGHDSRRKTFEKIKKSTDQSIAIDKHNLVCLMTGGVGAPASLKRFLGLPKHVKKGWKKETYGMVVSRLDFLRHCDTHLML